MCKKQILSLIAKCKHNIKYKYFIHKEAILVQSKTLFESNNLIINFFFFLEKLFEERKS